MLIEFPLKFEKNSSDFYFKVGTLCLCCSHSYSVKSLKTLISMLSPRSFIRTSNTRLQGMFSRFSSIACVT